MKVTVAICTWNRARLLDQTLAEMQKLRAPSGVQWEILVVNNNCCDDTDGVIARHSKRLPLRRLFESKPGKSYACNLAITEASGELILWTDDDVLVDPGLLDGYVEMARAWPDAAFFAGAIEPWFESKPPRWIRRHLASLKGVYVIADHSPEVRPLRQGEAVYGANMAFRSSVARQFSFNVNLGRIQGQLLGGDDTELVQRVTQSGYYGVWVPGARVKHFIPGERLTLSYVQKWYRDAGRNLVRRGSLGPCPSLLGAPRWAVVQYNIELAKSFLLSPGKGRRWLRAFTQAARLKGLIEESRELKRNDKKPTPNECSAAQ
jgi:glycosyltransferase involved in cell wall biosynthesis